ncbi:uncharacterized protein [Mytilus edulis]|uniref:uncharacterized protein n=1 Tax=Mytilus edulis TaxID=6550 RepID=UPI0039EF4E05
MVEFFSINCSLISFFSDVGYTALHIAVYHRYTDIVKLLIVGGIDLNTKNGVGDTALHIAVYHRYTEIVKLLIDGGIDLNIQDRQADCTDDLSSNHEDATNEQSDANDADTEDNEAPQFQSILQPLTSMASFSINLDQGNKSPAKKSGDNVKDLPDPVGDRSRNRRGRNNKNKKNDKPEGNIEQYFNGQASENTDTPKVKNTGKRNATTPTEDKHKDAGLIQKTKT